MCRWWVIGTVTVATRWGCGIRRRRRSICGTRTRRGLPTSWCVSGRRRMCRWWVIGTVTVATRWGCGIRRRRRSICGTRTRRGLPTSWCVSGRRRMCRWWVIGTVTVATRWGCGIRRRRRSICGTRTRRGLPTSPCGTDRGRPSVVGDFGCLGRMASVSWRASSGASAGPRVVVVSAKPQLAGRADLSFAFGTSDSIFVAGD